MRRIIPASMVTSSFTKCSNIAVVIHKNQFYMFSIVNNCEAYLLQLFFYRRRHPCISMQALLQSSSSFINSILIFIVLFDDRF